MGIDNPTVSDVASLTLPIAFLESSFFCPVALLHSFVFVIFEGHYSIRICLPLLIAIILAIAFLYIVLLHFLFL